MPAISIRHLSKTYANGTQALKDINLEVEAGDFFALLGANGAGKTTLIGILTSLVLKTAGEALVFEHDIDQHIHRAKAMMGVVPQELNFNMFEKVQDIIVNQGGYYGLPRKEAVHRCEVLLKQLELWEKRDQPSKNLSGGMKRRLMIARALIHQPKLLILDEPTAGVDVELRHSMWQFLKDLNRGGMTILLTTHYLEEVEQLCRHAAIIKNGEILLHDRVSRLVKLVENETFVISVDLVRALGPLQAFNPRSIDDNHFEVDLSKNDKIVDVLQKVAFLGMDVTDVRPKGNRLEKLFLHVMKQ